MKVLFAASECAPLAKVGGLADVVASLPGALKKEGVEAAVILPLYGKAPADTESLGKMTVRVGWREVFGEVLKTRENGVPVFLIKADYFFGGGRVYGYREGEAEKFLFFCLAVFEAIPHLGFTPDILHCHDWPTALIPLLNELRGRPYGTVMTIHNLRFQGLYSLEMLRELLDLDETWCVPDKLEFYGTANFLKAGILYADFVTTVSPRYREETLSGEAGERLDGVLRVKRESYAGVLNGLGDRWSPANAPVPFSAKEPKGKAACRKLLEKELGWKSSREAIFCVVSRLYEEKGIGLLIDAFEKRLTAGEKVRLCVLGTGDKGFEAALSALEARFPERVKLIARFDEPLSERVYAGGDFLLMPSRFEPCGLSQLIAMRYGTLPVVRFTGGLADTVKDVRDGGHGIVFPDFTAASLSEAIDRAQALYADRPAFNMARKRAMAADFSWEKSARAYRTIYETVCQSRQNGV